jgi:hypothetical protein
VAAQGNQETHSALKLARVPRLLSRPQARRGRVTAAPPTPRIAVPGHVVGGREGGGQRMRRCDGRPAGAQSLSPPATRRRREPRGRTRVMTGATVPLAPRQCGRGTDRDITASTHHEPKEQHDEFSHTR